MLGWFRRHARQGWSTCAFTQAALVRVVMQPAFAGRALEMTDAGELLLRNTAHPGHRLLPIDFGFDRVLEVCTGGLWGHRQVTDAWLLGTAVRHRCRLLTFDTGIAALLATDKERKAHLALPG